MNVYKLRYGVQQVLLDIRGEVVAVVRVWHGVGTSYLMVVVEGRDAGGHEGSLDELEIWFSGWLCGRSAKQAAVNREPCTPV